MLGRHFSLLDEYLYLAPRIGVSIETHVGSGDTYRRSIRFDVDRALEHTPRGAQLGIVVEPANLEVLYDGFFVRWIPARVRVAPALQQNLATERRFSADEVGTGTLSRFELTTVLEFGLVLFGRDSQ